MSAITLSRSVKVNSRAILSGDYLSGTCFEDTMWKASSLSLILYSFKYLFRRVF